MNDAAANPVRSVGLLLALVIAAALVTVEASEAGGSKVGGLAPLASSLSLANEAEAAGAGGGITVSLTRGPAGIEVEGRVPIQAPGAIAWGVLTDYDGIERFVSSMRKSRVTRRTNDSIIVEQEAVGHAFFFTRRLHVTLGILEKPPGKIRFEDVLGRDFKVYRGEWRIEPASSGVLLVYRLEADPTFPLPDFVARGLFRSTARQLLTEVRTEIERRATLAAR